MSFETVRVVRRTQETEFEIVVAPRTRPAAMVQLPNRLLGHFIDHLGKAAGLVIEPQRTDWPGSWTFDHVLCEDMGQLVGRAVGEIHRQRSTTTGVPGRARAECCMDDAQAEVVLSLEGRPRADWSTPDGADIDGFVDSWFEGDRVGGWTTGTNLRQFVDGFAIGAGATLSIRAARIGNLHHFYEVVFRALGDALQAALELGGRVAGDSSGLAGAAVYDVRTVATDEVNRD